MPRLLTFLINNYSGLWTSSRFTNSAAYAIINIGENSMQSSTQDLIKHLEDNLPNTRPVVYKYTSTKSISMHFRVHIDSGELIVTVT